MSIDAILTSPALAGMRACPQWVVYALVPLADGRTNKIPLHYATGIPAGVNDPASWTDPITAANAARKWGPEFGVGFCFTEAAGFWFVDLDGALQPDGTWSPLAQQACTVFAGAAVEVSRSGRGLHLFGRGAIPPHASKNIAHHAELYHTDRFVALSGLHLSGDCTTDHTAALGWFASTYFPPRVAMPTDIPDTGPRADWRGPADDEELLRRAMQSRSAASTFGTRATFADLWAADAAALGRAYPPDASSQESFDRSSADAALAAHLAFWTGCDAARMDRLMRQSALVREKYDRTDYLPRTISNACGQQREVLIDRPVQASGLPTGAPGGTAAPENFGTSEVPAGYPPSAPGTPVMQAVTGETFLSAAAQAQLLAGCVYVVDAHRALVPGGHLVKPDQFKAIFGGYTWAMDARNERTSRNAWEAFTESQVLRAPRADGTCFRPDLPFGAMVHDAGRVRVNTYWPVNVPRQAGDPSRFLAHVAKLLPDERDRTIVLCYMAACVQHAGVKFQWAPLIQGVEGNGKTLLSRCTAEAIGRRYVHWPKASKLSKQFNGWMVGKLLYCVEDIHTSEHNDVIEELKPMITGGDGLEIEAKGVDQISAEICGNFIFNTNHKNGLRKTRNDRRFSVMYCAQQSVDDLTRDGMDGQYMPEMYAWLRAEGYAIVSEYLHTLPIPDEFNPATLCQRAPRTSSTAEAIAASLGRVEQEIMEAVEQGLPGFAGGWMSSTAVDRLMDRLGRAGSVPPNRRREMLQTLGYAWHPALRDGRVDNIVAPDGTRPRLYVTAGHAALALTAPAEVARAYTAAQGVH